MFIEQEVSLSNISILKTQEELVELNLEHEFSLILHSVLTSTKDGETHIVNRLRKMRNIDGNDFYTLAAETVVACANTVLRKEEKYYHIGVFFDKLRRVVDMRNSVHADILTKVAALVDKSIDIFDY
jgi:hypothetical protein